MNVNRSLLPSPAGASSGRPSPASRFGLGGLLLPGAHAIERLAQRIHELTTFGGVFSSSRRPLRRRSFASMIRCSSSGRRPALAEIELSFEVLDHLLGELDFSGLTFAGTLSSSSIASMLRILRAAHGGITSPLSLGSTATRSRGHRARPCRFPPCLSCPRGSPRRPPSRPDRRGRDSTGAPRKSDRSPTRR